MEKKLILSSHICNIECMRLVLWKWSFESNCNACSTKNRPFGLFTYCEKSKTISVIVDFFFFIVVYFRTVLNYIEIFLHCSKLYRDVQPLNWKYGTIQMLLNLSARFMKLFNILIENMALFKYVQDYLAARSKIKKKFNEILVVENQTCFFR